MIVRMWHGRTALEQADAYAAFLAQRAIPDYRSVPGNLAVYVLRRDEADATHFVTLTHWVSEEAIRGFAGEDLLKAKYYPEDAGFLLEFEPRVVHYTVVAAEFTTGPGQDVSPAGQATVAMLTSSPAGAAAPSPPPDCAPSPR